MRIKKTIEERREYQRKRIAKRRLDVEFVKKEREYYKKWYRKNGRNRASNYSKAIIEWQKNNPEKVKACGLLRYAIQVGKIIKPLYCQVCNRKTKIVCHHSDYLKPFEVTWLCVSCHKLEHSKFAS